MAKWPSPAPPFSPTPPHKPINLSCQEWDTQTANVHTLKSKPTSHTLCGRLLQTLGTKGGKAAESSSEFPNTKKEEK